MTERPAAPAATAPAATAPAAAERTEPMLRRLPAGQARLWVSLGARDDLEVDALRQGLADLAGLDPEDLLEVDRRLRHSYVVVPSDYAQDVIDAVDGERLGGKRIRVELAKEEA